MFWSHQTLNYISLNVSWFMLHEAWMVIWGLKVSQTLSKGKVKCTARVFIYDQDQRVDFLIFQKSLLTSYWFQSFFKKIGRTCYSVKTHLIVMVLR